MVRKCDKSNERTLLLALLSEAFDRKSWHGTNLRGSFRGMSADDARKVTGASRHSVAEIVVHCAYWKYSVRRRLRDEGRGGFPLAGSDWFALEDSLSDSAWKKYVRILVDEHRQLCNAVEEFDVRRLNATPDGGKVPFGMLIRGAAMHDVYHAGQIQLVKRA